MTAPLYPDAPDTSATLPSGHVDNTEGDFLFAAEFNNHAIVLRALETRVGTGQSAPAPGTVLTGTGTGAADWLPQTFPPFMAMFGPLDRNAVSRATKLTADAIAGKFDWPASILAQSESPITIASQIAGAAPGQHIRLKPGFYPETVTISVAGLTIEAGADVAWTVMDNWSAGGSAGCTWSAPAAPDAANGIESSLSVPAWSTEADVGQFISGNGATVTNQVDQVLVDHVFFNRVADATALGPGQWKYNNSAAGTGNRRVIIYLPGGAGTHKIEVTTRASHMVVAAAGLTLDGIFFYGGASQYNQNPPLQNSSHADMVIQNCMIGKTHGLGLAMGGASGCKVLNTIFDNCGSMGAGTNVATGFVARGCVLFNNGGTQNHFGGALEGSNYALGPGIGGIKIAATSGGVFDGCFAWNNGGPAYWHDVLCDAGVVSECWEWDGRGTPIQYEVSWNGTIKGNRVLLATASTRFPGQTSGVGIFVSSSREVDVGPDNLVIDFPVGIGFRWDAARTDLPPGGTNNAGSGLSRRNHNFFNRVIARKRGDGSTDSPVQWVDGNAGADISDASNTGWGNVYGLTNGVDDVTGMTWADDYWWYSDLLGQPGQDASGFYFNITEWAASRWESGVAPDGNTYKARMMTAAEEAHDRAVFG